MKFPSKSLKALSGDQAAQCTVPTTQHKKELQRERVQEAQRNKGGLVQNQREKNQQKERSHSSYSENTGKQKSLDSLVDQMTGE